MALKTTTNGTINPKVPSISRGPAPDGSQDMRTLGERASNGSGPMFAPASPTMWMTMADTVTNGPSQWRGNNVRRVKRPDGSVGIERLPSTCHADDDYTNRRPHARGKARYRMMLDQYGHVVAICHTNGAAHLTSIELGRYSRDPYTQRMLGKALAFGWIDVNGGCLKRQVADGLVDARKLLVSLDKAKVCAKDSASCKHIESEREARQAKNAAAMTKLETQHKSREQKRDEDQSTILSAIQTLLSERK